MKKFTFIGAGSLDFTKDLVRDILTFEAFRDAELMLMDIDPKRLEYAVKGVQKIVDAGKYPAVVKGTHELERSIERCGWRSDHDFAGRCGSMAS